MTQLLAFYREDALIKPIYSDQNTFFDESLYANYEALIVPLMPYQNQDAWELSSYSEFLSPMLKGLLDQHIVMVTHYEEASDFFALMYAPPNSKTMSRTGYLLQKKDNALQPVLVTIDGKEYLVEMKGCGSPVGLFPTTHHRNQAGCFNKAHLKVTGALNYVEAVREFETLVAKDQLFQDRGLASEVKVLAKTRFRYLNLDFGVLIRLVPSSIRASFSKHPDLDALMPDKHERSYTHMGRRVGALLSADQPLHHQNLSINNMVYIDKSSYDLTDWSEVDTLFSSHCAMDYFRCLFPVLYLNNNLELQHLHDFCAGMHDSLGLIPLSKQALSSTEAYLDLHHLYLGGRGHDFYHYTKEKGQDLDGLDENISYFKHFFGEDYFELPTRQWLSEKALPSLQARLSVLEYLSDLCERLSEDELKRLLTFQFDDDSLQEYQDELLRLYPAIIGFKKSGKAIKDLSQTDIGHFKGAVGFDLEFLKDLKRSNISIYKSRLSTLIADMKYFLKTGAIIVPTRHDFLTFKMIPTPHHLAFLMYPFLFVLYAFFETEKQFLEGSLTKATDSEKEHIKSILAKQDKIEHQFLNDPESIKSLFTKDPDGFKMLFVWDN